MYYDFNKPFNLFLDTTTHCNVACPQCHRTNPFGLGKVDWLPLVSWTYEQVVKMFPPHELKLVRNTKLCGTWGDPMMTKDIGKILPYLAEHVQGRVSVDTNASMRTDDFWWDLGVKCGKKLTIVFDIDGTTQRMHEKYRRKSNLKTVLSNMETFAAAGGRANSQTIVFNHNHPHKAAIAEMCKSYGSDEHNYVVSDRFRDAYSKDKGTQVNVVPFNFIDADGNPDSLIRAPLDNQPPAFKAVRGKTRLEKKTEDIECEWGMKQEVAINPDGQVLPCCFLANTAYPFMLGIGNNTPDLGIKASHYDNYFDTQSNGAAFHPIMAEYYGRKDDFNVNHRSLNEILHDEWYQTVLLESIKGPSPIRQCVEFCSNRVRKIHQERTVAI